MKEDNKRIYRGNIEGYPISINTETDTLIKDIADKTKQTSVNKADEVEVMLSMLNDKEFKVAIYDRNKGYVGTRSPRGEAIALAVDTLSGATGMSTVEAQALTENYTFTKRDANRYINMGKDFVSTYLQTGRKLQIVSEPRGEACINMKYVDGKEKSIPDRDNPGKTKTIVTSDSIKINVTNKKVNNEK